MPFIAASTDGAQLHYVDYVPASSPAPFQLQTKDQPPSGTEITLVFIHGWPMSSAMYEHLMLPLCESWRLRCVAVDRRGFGKSEWSGHAAEKKDVGYETFARDTLDVLAALDLGRFVFVASSMGCGETVLAYGLMGAEMRQRCKGMVWLGPSLPFPLKTESNPMAPPRELWDAILAGLRADRPGFVKAAMPGIFGVPAGIEVGADALARFEGIVGQADALATERCVGIITAKDFTEDLRALGKEEGLAVLVVHGDSDQGAPYEATSKLVGELMPRADVQVYEKAAHGLYLTHAARLIEGVVGFVAKVGES